MSQGKQNIDEDNINLDQDINSRKRAISTNTTMENINIGHGSSILSEGSSNQKSEKFSKITYMKNEEDSSEFQSFMKRPKYKIYLSTRYRGPKIKEQLSSSFQEMQNNIHNLNVRRIPDSFIYRVEKETTKKKYSMTSGELSEQNHSMSYSKSQSEKDIFKPNNNKDNAHNNRGKKISMIPQNIMNPIKYYDDGNSLLDTSKKMKIEKSINNYESITTNINIQKSYSIKNLEQKEKENEKIDEIQKNEKNLRKIEKISENENDSNNIQKNKYNGVLSIVEGVNNYHRRQAHYETKPKVIKYLNYFAKNEKLKCIVNKKIRNNNRILKNHMYKWFEKSIKLHSIINKQNEKERELTLKAKIFIRRIQNVKNKQKREILRKYFYRYLKNILIIAKKEEHQKYLDVYKNDSIDIINNNKSYTYKKSSQNKIIPIGANNVSDILKGSKIVEKYVRRCTHGDILETLTRKINDNLKKKYLIKIIKMKEKKQKN